MKTWKVYTGGGTLCIMLFQTKDDATATEALEAVRRKLRRPKATVVVKEAR